MPIPLMQAEEPILGSERRTSLQLVPQIRIAAEPTKYARLYPRAFAHFIDACVVNGLSVYSAKVFSVILLSLHAHAINDTGRMTSPVFQEAFAYSSGQLFAASFASLALLYFVGLPLATGRTLGLGLLGLRLGGDNGAVPTLRQLSLRLIGCGANYATGGLLCVSLGRRDGRFFQDMISETRVVRD